MPPRRRRSSSRRTRALLRAVLPPAPRRPRPGPRARVRTAAPDGEGRWVAGRHVGPAGGRGYFVYLPKGYRRTTRAPLLVALHGCGQTAAQFAATTRFNRLADRHGFVVVYPEQPLSRHQMRCWRWYEAAHQERGAGEPAVIAGIVAALVAATDRWRIDPRRVFAAGLSAGGAMALVLAATYPDVFAAIGVHSAPAYGSAESARDALAALAGRRDARTARPAAPGAARMPPTILFQGTIDTTVRGANAERVADQWLEFCRAHMTGPTDRERITRSRTGAARTADGRAYTTTRWFSARGRTMLEHWRVHGLGHAWSGGAKGGSYSDPRGPRASTAMWRFFAARDLDPPAG